MHHHDAVDAAEPHARRQQRPERYPEHEHIRERVDGADVVLRVREHSRRRADELAAPERVAHGLLAPAVLRDGLGAPLYDEADARVLSVCREHALASRVAANDGADRLDEFLNLGGLQSREKRHLMELQIKHLHSLRLLKSPLTLLWIDYIINNHMRMLPMQHK